MQAAAVSSTPDSERLRRTMADCQLRTFDVTSAAVIDAFESLPREKFVAPADAANLPTSPQNLTTSLTLDNAFWGDKGDEIRKRFTTWISQ